MYKCITEAVLYNSFGCELDRCTLNEFDITRSLVDIIKDNWTISEGDTIKIVSRTIKYY